MGAVGLQGTGCGVRRIDTLLGAGPWRVVMGESSRWMGRALRRIAPGLAYLVVAAAFGRAPRIARAGDAIPPEGLRLPLTGKQTVRNDGKNYYLDGACVIPPGSEIRIEQNVRVYGLNGASLDVQGGLSVHGTKDSWVYFVNVDFSPTTSPDKMMHLDMASLHGCKLVHAQDAAFAGGITIENCCWQYDCKFDVKVASGFLRIMTTEFTCPCKVEAMPTKGKAVEFAIRTCWMKDTTFKGGASGTIRHSEVRGPLVLNDVTDFVLDGTDLFAGATVRQASPASFSKVQLTKCNLLAGSELVLERPAGADVKAERVQVERFFFENENGGAVLLEKDAGERVKDGVDDPTQAVKAIVVTPNKRRHVFLSSSLRQRAPPVGGAR